MWTTAKYSSSKIYQLDYNHVSFMELYEISTTKTKCPYYQMIELRFEQATSCQATKNVVHR